MQNKIEITKKENHIIKKHRKLVHNIPIKMSQHAQQYVLALMAMVRTNDNDFKMYSTSAKELSNILNVDINMRALRGIAKELINVSFEYSDNNNKLVFVNMFSTIKINKATLQIEGEFSNGMKELLLNLDNGFLQYDFFYGVALGGSYLLSLYEICKDTLDCTPINRKQVRFNINIEELRKKLSLDSLNAKGEYTYKYSHIKSRIFQEAEKQFIQHTDISFSFEEIKHSRRVTDLDVLIERVIDKPEKKVSNFKPYLQFRDWLLENIPLNEDYCEEIDDGVWLFDLGSGFMARIDEHKNEIHLADENGAFIDSTYQEDMDEVDEGWQRVYEDRDEIKRRLR